MSLLTLLRRQASDGFPRVSGDEPWKELSRKNEARFSPRERG